MMSYLNVTLDNPVNRGGDCYDTLWCSERLGVPTFQEKDPQGHQGRQHPAEHGGPRQTGRLWGGRTTYCECTLYLAVE